MLGIFGQRVLKTIHLLNCYKNLTYNSKFLLQSPFLFKWRKKELYNYLLHFTFYIITQIYSYFIISQIIPIYSFSPKKESKTSYSTKFYFLLIYFFAISYFLLNIERDDQRYDAKTNHSDNPPFPSLFHHVLPSFYRSCTFIHIRRTEELFMDFVYFSVTKLLTFTNFISGVGFSVVRTSLAGFSD